MEHYHCENPNTGQRCLGTRNKSLAEAQARHYEEQDGEPTVVRECNTCADIDLYSLEFEQFLLKKYNIKESTND